MLAAAIGLNTLSLWQAPFQLAGGLQSPVVCYVREVAGPATRKLFKLYGLESMLLKLVKYPIVHFVLGFYLEMIYASCIGDPFGVFLAQNVVTILALLTVIAQKFTSPALYPDDPYTCDLTDPEENAWGFGQILAMILLCLPFLEAAEAFSG